MLDYMIFISRALIFAFWKLELNIMYNAYLNESRLKYHISILGGGGSKIWENMFL